METLVSVLRLLLQDAPLVEGFRVQRLNGLSEPCRDLRELSSGYLADHSPYIHNYNLAGLRWRISLLGIAAHLEVDEYGALKEPIVDVLVEIKLLTPLDEVLSLLLDLGILIHQKVLSIQYFI